MSALPPLSAVLRCLLFGLLIALAVVRPVLAFSDEALELSHSMAAIDAQAQDHPPSEPGDDQQGDCDPRWHLSHCCGLQAALLPALAFAAPALPAPAVQARAPGEFVPAPTATPFRPPISA
ncbi:hypothetical protein [Lysobacter silvisoli]|uniref:DUF2946 domain-containing protein n=1 Tax=Lysobacter silvisoli TaxID=2293254 RepID=A0A371K0E2_9GAMM|nr:hypothetical protein [Lysobacter silvisoli]RDZ27393.1 hypothetical protein DX914_14270 [Lysobacter silvisoli]